MNFAFPMRSKGGVSLVISIWIVSSDFERDLSHRKVELTWHILRNSAVRDLVSRSQVVVLPMQHDSKEIFQDLV